MSIEPTDKASALIRVYDTDGNTRITVKAFAGDMIGYKRNGGGYFRCCLFAIRDGRLTLLPEEGGRKFSVPSSSRAFLHLFRKDVRVTERAT